MAYSLSGERPYAAAWPIAAAVALVRALARRVKAHRQRVALTALLDLEDHRLWDVGISREDLHRALRSDDFDIEAVRDQRRGFDIWPPA